MSATGLHEPSLNAMNENAVIKDYADDDGFSNFPSAPPHLCVKLFLKGERAIWRTKYVL